MGNGVAANGAAMFLHFLDHRCSECVGASIDVIGVEEDGEWKSHFLKNRKGICVDCFPTIVDGDKNGAVFDGFFSTFPRRKIL